MPAWLHRRAEKILEDTRKQYGAKKGKEVAFAVATMQSHALGKSPKGYGTPEGKREAKQKYDEPSKMKKSAQEALQAPPQDPVQAPPPQEEEQQEESRGASFVVYDHEGNAHRLDASSIKSKTDLERVIAPLMYKCPYGQVKQKVEEAWKALSEHRGQKAQEESSAPEQKEAVSSGRYLRPTELVKKWTQVKESALPFNRNTPPRVIAQDLKANAEQGLAPNSSGMSITAAARRGWTVDDAIGVAEKVAAAPSEDQVADYLKGNPNPPDEQFHSWAEANGWSPDEAEATAYRLATRHAQFMLGGRSGEEGKSPSDFSADQVEKGIKVEKEHTENIPDREKITADHLTEDPKYYNDPLFESDLKKAGALFPVIPHFLSALGKIMEKRGQDASPPWLQTLQNAAPVLQMILNPETPAPPQGQQLLEQAAQTGTAAGQRRLEEALRQTGQQ